MKIIFTFDGDTLKFVISTKDGNVLAVVNDEQSALGCKNMYEAIIDYHYNTIDYQGENKLMKRLG